MIIWSLGSLIPTTLDLYFTNGWENFDKILFWTEKMLLISFFQILPKLLFLDSCKLPHQRKSHIWNSPWSSKFWQKELQYLSPTSELCNQTRRYHRPWWVSLVSVDACHEIAQRVKLRTVEPEAPSSNPAASKFFRAMLQCVTRDRVYKIPTKQTYNRISVHMAW